MDEMKKMLRAIINSQGSFRQEILKKLEVLDIKITTVDKKVDRVEENLTKRIDKIGLQLAYLEDDTPIRENHEKLEKRIIKLEQKTFPAL
jgi:ABC-type hemin transport system substrate-binding protein